MADTQPQATDLQKKEIPPQNIDETLNVANQFATDAKTQVTEDLGIAANLAGKAGEQSAPIIENISALRQDIDEKTASFEARVKRIQSPYVLSPELAKVQEVAEILEKPLLLEGEPGTGKTSLAYALAGHKDLPIIHAQCKSTTTAEKLLYSIDEIGRFRDAQSGKDVSDLSNYVRYGPLGEAFKSQEPVILLIDEVDKAKREFTNDLLHELDQMSFFIPETGQEVSAKFRPIVIITSNHEKDLPEPVLRRCVYEFIDFPTPEQMSEIVKAHLPDVEEKLLGQAVETFYKLRESADLAKKPSTSEMLDWVKVLIKFGVEDIHSEKEVPYLNTLIKVKEDLDKLKKPENKESLTRDGLPFEINEILDGKHVIKIKGGWSDQDRLKILLANEEVPFETDYFNIKVKGVKKGNSDYMFSFDLQKQEAIEVYEMLRRNDLVSEEMAQSETKIKFANISRSTDKIVIGSDSNSTDVYKMPDGNYYTWVTPSNDENTEGSQTTNNEDDEENLLGESTLAKLRPTRKPVDENE